MVAGASGGVADDMSISGCVFFICTADLEGGSGRTVMRSFSFFGLSEADGGIPGNGMAATAGFEIRRLDFGAANGDGATSGGGGIGVFPIGGPAALIASFAGGWLGKLIRTASRVAGALGDVAAGGGGSVLRTVSFFASVESVIRSPAYT